MNAAELSPRRRRRRFLVGYEEGDVTVKREPADEDIKDYAETTMNELLGWYGYEKVDSRDTQGLNLTHFASTNNNNNNNNPSSSNGNASPPSSAMEGSDVSEDGGNTSPHTNDLQDGPDRLRPDSISPGPDEECAPGKQKDTNRAERKKPRNENMWKANQRKYLRNSGKAYFDRKGKLHASKEFKPRPNGMICKNRQCDHLSEDAYRSIFTSLWELSDYNVQNSFIRDCITLKVIARRRAPKVIQDPKREVSSKSATRIYHFEYDGCKYDVCKTCFLRTLQISSCRVNEVCKKSTPDAVLMHDKRGRKPNPR